MGDATTACQHRSRSQEDGVTFVGFQALALATPAWVGEAWTLRISWQPCLYHPDSAADAARGWRRCAYPDQQRVMAFAKSENGKEGLFLVTTWGEAGVFT